MTRILVTGASGFVGRLLVQRLLDAGFVLNLAGRTEKTPMPGGENRYFAVGEIGSRTDWRAALQGCEAVMHLAAQVPLPGVPNQAFEEVNDRGTARLVEQCAASEAKLLILMSTVFAVADNSADAPIDEQTQPNPATPYGRSKLASESHLKLFRDSGRCGIILRPPIVYGEGAKGNWRLLQRLAASGLPLPFGAVRNRRTLIAAENLIDAIVRLISLPPSELKSGAYMVSDQESVSLTEILTWLHAGMAMSSRLLPVSPALLEFSLKALGKQNLAKSLLGNLEVDSTLFRETFGWSPAVHPREGIIRSGAGFQR